jgi:pentose-5-phosphate-3-epimerase
MGNITLSDSSSLLNPRGFFLGPPVLACVSKGVPGIFMDCHMMVSQPEKVCDAYLFLQVHTHILS